MKHSLAVTSFLMSLFLLTQFVGLLIVDSYTDKEATAQTGQIAYKSLPYSIERPDIKPESSVWLILAAVIAGTIIMLILIRLKQVNLWKLWFFLSVLLTLSIALSSFINPLFAFIIGLAFSAWKVFKPNVYIHNLTEVFIYGGLAAIFVPILNITSAFILLLLISAYDMFAVWQSKHMVKMAKFQTRTNLFSGIYIPRGESPKKALTKKAKLEDTGESSGGAVLGGGDMGFPLIFAGVVMKQYGFLHSLVIPTAASIALLGLLLVGKKNKFYPAMPFITAACFIGYGIVAYSF
ncbi:hypothetical protein HYY72_05405 [Candidatus Woesearchaeota archaeon]|nr:hypothetical protein [Candidatus Woesearchaeota archaeon]